MLKRVRFLGESLGYIGKSSEIFLHLEGNFSPPQARKHCRNGGPDTDSYWDHKQNGKIKQVERYEREQKEGRKNKLNQYITSLRAQSA